MRIRLVVDKSGPRWDGQDWPVRGGEIDVPDDEGMALCGQGDAVPVVTDNAETPEQADAVTEVRSVTAAVAKPIVNSPKAAWVDHAVSQGADRAEAEAMKKTELIAAYGTGG
jgi:hypothetical protein